jgi:hypothetical protein
MTARFGIIEGFFGKPWDWSARLSCVGFLRDLGHQFYISKARTGHLYLDPWAGAWELPVDLVAGLAINPMNQAHLTRIAICRFQQLVMRDRAADRASIMPDCCQDLGGPIFAAQLQEDRALMQETGLGRMDDGTRLRLLARYGSAHSNPYAQEIAAWLRNEYLFDAQCLTT